MNVMLAVDFQAYIPSQNASGTEQARAENENRPVIQPVQQNSSLRQSTQQQGEQSPGFSNQQAATKDKVSLSKQGQEAAKNDKANDDSKIELSEDEKKKVQDLKDRDREVKIHEQAHAAVGGQYAGAPSYTFETGPDGKRYAVGGEVSIDVSEEKEPKDTVQKMQVVRAAALAPAEPSTQDLKVAAEASQKEQQARAEVSQNQLEPNSTADNETSNIEAEQSSAGQQQSKLAQTYSDISANRPSSQFSASA